MGEEEQRNGTELRKSSRTGSSKVCWANDSFNSTLTSQQDCGLC